jgi:two-component system KDP operon response regulator KdpE
MRKKILVVDDEPDVRFILQSILRGKGFETAQSDSVSMCLQQLDDFEPDVVILDIDLPDGSGLETLPIIKAKRPNITVIMNSALDTSENRAKAQEYGADAFLGKPINKNLLLELLAA